MTHEARSMSGIILISVPTIRYGGCFLLTCLITRVTVHGESASSKFLPGGTCPCRRDLILSLVSQILAGTAALSSPLLWFVRMGS